MDGTVTLALVTCGPQLEVALEVPQDPGVSVVRLAGVSRRSSLVLAAVDLVMEDAGLEPEALARIVVSRGPGSFTGIRSGIATAQGLAVAIGGETMAFSSLTMQAARSTRPGEVWTAQPGRRGEVYARLFRTSMESPPEPLSDLEVMAIGDLHRWGPWLAAETLGLEGAERFVGGRSAAEALLELVRRGAKSEPFEPLYVEGPPIHGGSR